ncbi:MAG: histone H1 [Chloroflexi bacterium]|nr:histone H1 [Chloroflexota bacterium]
MARRKKKEHDFAVTAFRVVQEATGQLPPEPQKPKKQFDAKALGHKGGLKGGKARAAKLTPEQRSNIAKNAAKARWGKNF